VKRFAVLPVFCLESSKEVP